MYVPISSDWDSLNTSGGEGGHSITDVGSEGATFIGWWRDLCRFASGACWHPYGALGAGTPPCSCTVGPDS
jgi:hypothetical protein